MVKTHGKTREEKQGMVKQEKKQGMVKQSINVYGKRKRKQKK